MTKTYDKIIIKFQGCASKWKAEINGKNMRCLRISWQYWIFHAKKKKSYDRYYLNETTKIRHRNNHHNGFLRVLCILTIFSSPMLPYSISVSWKWVARFPKCPGEFNARFWFLELLSCYSWLWSIFGDANVRQINSGMSILD